MPPAEVARRGGGAAIPSWAHFEASQREESLRGQILAASSPATCFLIRPFGTLGTAVGAAQPSLRRPPHPTAGTFPVHTSLLAIYSHHRANDALWVTELQESPAGRKRSPPPRPAQPQGGSCLAGARDEPWGGCPPGSSCGRRGHAAGQGGRLTSLPVTEFTARHGKIPTKLSSPPLLQPDAEFWHPPGWQPLGRAALVAAQAREGGGLCPPHSRIAAPRSRRCKRPQLFDAQGDWLHYLGLRPFLSSQR